jgi:hypothetical protein
VSGRLPGDFGIFRCVRIPNNSYRLLADTAR